eukprot:TRINITY_DN7606_c0_g1_i1.p1 TRINITY_DN7606_c0_g1~~TRINITY_DN7606_c0_g1_i1.p1  ORF type:complete len:294 (-),score=81.76 TRINITY_DN7606_c0_g1_i1:120-1001(-)
MARRIVSVFSGSSFSQSVRCFASSAPDAVYSSGFLRGKRVLITGSTSGIGLGFAKAFAGEGCAVMLNGLGNASEINAIQAELRSKYNTPVDYHGADMSKQHEVEDMVASTIAKFGGIDVLINNAGIQHVSSVDAFPTEKWKQVMAINLDAPFFAIRAALPDMKKRGWGRIINVSSVHGLVASVNKSAYVASKFGLVGLTKVVALENAGSGITCNTINPGWVLTPLVEKQIEARAKDKGLSLEDAAKDLLAEKQPSKQFVTVEALAQAALFLCQNGAAQITGISLPLDGGWTSQ